jgi:hypothetical protein
LNAASGGFNLARHGTHNQLANGSLRYLTRIEAGSPLAGSGAGGADVGANLVNRIGSSGTRFGDSGYNTPTPIALWPWPNEARIKREMCGATTRGFCSNGTRVDGSGPITQIQRVGRWCRPGVLLVQALGTLALLLSAWQRDARHACGTRR